MKSRGDFRGFRLCLISGIDDILLVQKLIPPSSGLVSPTVAPPAFLPEASPPSRSTTAFAGCNQVKAIRGVSSRARCLPIAILIALIASYFFVNAWHHGRVTDWIIAGILSFFHYRYLRCWLHYRLNQCVVFYDDKTMFFRETLASLFSTRFDRLRWIDHDKSGYILILELGDQFRLVRSDMQPDLQRILDAHQARLEWEDQVAHAASSAA